MASARRARRDHPDGRDASRRARSLQRHRCGPRDAARRPARHAGSGGRGRPGRCAAGGRPDGGPDPLGIQRVAHPGGRGVAQCGPQRRRRARRRPHRHREARAHDHGHGSARHGPRRRQPRGHGDRSPERHRDHRRRGCELRVHARPGAGDPDRGRRTVPVGMLPARLVRSGDQQSAGDPAQPAAAGDAQLHVAQRDPGRLPGHRCRQRVAARPRGRVRARCRHPRGAARARRAHARPVLRSHGHRAAEQRRTDGVRDSSAVPELPCQPDADDRHRRPPRHLDGRHGGAGGELQHPGPGHGRRLPGQRHEHAADPGAQRDPPRTEHGRDDLPGGG